MLPVSAMFISCARALRFAAEGANIAFTDLNIDEAGKETEAEIAAMATSWAILFARAISPALEAA